MKTNLSMITEYYARREQDTFVEEMEYRAKVDTHEKWSPGLHNFRHYQRMDRQLHGWAALARVLKSVVTTVFTCGLGLIARSVRMGFLGVDTHGYIKGDPLVDRRSSLDKDRVTAGEIPNEVRGPLRGIMQFELVVAGLPLSRDEMEDTDFQALHKGYEEHFQPANYGYAPARNERRRLGEYCRDIAYDLVRQVCQDEAELSEAEQKFLQDWLPMMPIQELNKQVKDGDRFKAHIASLRPDLDLERQYEDYYQLMERWAEHKEKHPDKIRLLDDTDHY